MRALAWLNEHRTMLETAAGIVVNGVEDVGALVSGTGEQKRSAAVSMLVSAIPEHKLPAFVSPDELEVIAGVAVDMAVWKLNALWGHDWSDAPKQTALVETARPEALQQVAEVLQRRSYVLEEGFNNGI